LRAGGGEADDHVLQPVFVFSDPWFLLDRAAILIVDQVIKRLAVNIGRGLSQDFLSGADGKQHIMVIVQLEQKVRTAECKRHKALHVLH
jgi:hypothetical protein